MFLKLCSAESKGSAKPCLGLHGMTAALFILCILQVNNILYSSVYCIGVKTKLLYIVAMD